MRFSTKLTALMAGVVLVIIAVVSYSVYTLNRNILQDEISDRLEDQAFQAMDKIDRMLFERFADIKLIATDSIISSRESTAREITKRLIAYRNQYKAYASLSFYDLNRIRIADTAGLYLGKQHAMVKYWEDVLGGKVSAAADIRVAEDLQVPVIYFASSVKGKDGEIFGVVVARTPISKIYEIVGPAIVFHESEEVFHVDLVDKGGLLLYSNYNKEGILKDNLSDWEFMERFRSGEKTGSGIYRHSDDGEEIYSFVPERGYQDFKGNDWLLTIHIPTRIAFAPAAELRNKIIAILLPIVIFSVLIVLLFSRTISRSIVKLRDATIEIGKGNLDYKIDMDTKDEVGQLSRAFNQMVDDLKRTTTSIDILNREIAERKRAEETLKKSERFLANIFASIQDGISVLDKDMNIIRVNPVMEQWYAHAMPLIGKKCYRVYHSSDTRCEICPSHRTLTTREAAYEIVPKRDADKNTIGWFDLYSFPLFDSETGQLTGVIEYARDITERIKAERDLKVAQGLLLQSEKMAAVGQLASGVAHEVKNPLQIIIQGINYLEREIGPGQKKLSRTLKMLKNAVRRSDGIIRVLLDFARVRSFKIQPYKITKVVEIVLELVKKNLKVSNVEVIKDFQGSLPLGLFDINRMQQVFINLILNSMRAMPNGGKLFLRVYTNELAGVKNGVGRRAADFFKPGEVVLVCEVEDTGVGIAEDKLNKVFDPFFTTAPVGKGTGLGLSITREIIEETKGLIEIESRIGKGTKVSITLPIAKGGQDV